MSELTFENKCCHCITQCLGASKIPVQLNENLMCLCFKFEDANVIINNLERTSGITKDI